MTLTSLTSNLLEALAAWAGDAFQHVVYDTQLAVLSFMERTTTHLDKALSFGEAEAGGATSLAMLYMVVGAVAVVLGLRRLR
jgi:hypothetical protein